MHALAEQLLERFRGVGWSGLHYRFGSFSRTTTASRALAVLAMILAVFNLISLFLPRSLL